MDSKALINETLKYLEQNENGTPKYRFEIYKNGINETGNRMLNALTFGLAGNTETNNEGPVPVSIYTISDIFDTIGSVSDDVMMNIEALSDTINNLKMSLKQLGYNALNMTLDTLENAVMSIEVVQQINEIYRVAKPLVEKVRDIATIMFYFPSSAKVAQDVINYLSRFAVSTAKSMLTKLWDILLDTPVFAVYENDETADLLGAYSTLSDKANNLVENIVSSRDAFGDIMKYANGSIVSSYEPSYSEIGVDALGDIVDVFNDPTNGKIYIATKHTIWNLKENYSLREILTTNDDVEIEKIYICNNKIYYISENIIYDEDGDYFPLNNPKIIYSYPILLYNNTAGKIYNAETGAEESIGIPNGQIEYTAFDFGRMALYCVVKTTSGSTRRYLVRIMVNSDGTYSSEELSELGEIYGMAYFNDAIYIVKKDGSIYNVSKLSAGMDFSCTNYVYSPENNRDLNIIYSDGNLATDGLYIYTQSNNSLTNPKKAKDTINCVTRKVYNGTSYLVTSGGSNIQVARSVGNSITWYSKDLYFEPSTVNDLVEVEDVPDSIAGCLWINAPKQYFIAYSQKNIYLVDPTHIHEIFDFPPEPTPDTMKYKEFVEFEEWWKEEPDVPNPYVNVTKKINVGDCIITSSRVIGNDLYFALFNPNYNEETSDSVVKTGIYKAVISYLNGEYDIKLLYNNPLYTVKPTENIKIYSFNKINGSWYCTNGTSLFNLTVGSETKLDIGTDRAISIVNNNSSPRIFTGKSVLNINPVRSYGEISTSVNYTSTNKLQIASTENSLMISDGEFVYNAFNKGDDAIDNELFQICYKKFVDDYNMIQSSNAVFITSGSILKTIPFYDSTISYNYGCGYYTDTTPNKWYGAAPYYFASNVLNNGKNKLNRNIFIKSFYENFKVELNKLLNCIPAAFVEYTNNKLKSELSKLGYTLDGDDGQIVNLIIDSVSSTTANSIGMYVHDKFLEKLGDDNTFETFAESVYRECIADKTNSMTDDFYKIFEELYYSTIAGAMDKLHFGQDGMAGFLLRYYQNHKAEWAKSMTDLIDIDTVDPDIYEVPLKTAYPLKQTTYRFNYETGEYEYSYIATPSKDYNNVVEGYLRDNDFYTEASGGSIIDHRTTDSDKTYYAIDGRTICYKNPENNKYYQFKIQDYSLTEDTTVTSGKTYYEKVDEEFDYSLTEDTTEGDKNYYTPVYSLTNDTSVTSGKDYFSRSGGKSEYTLMTGSTLPLGTYYEKQEYKLTTDTSIEFTQTGGLENPELIYLVYVDETDVTRYNVIFTQNSSGEYVLYDGKYYYDPESEETKYSVSSATESSSGDYYSYEIYDNNITTIYAKDYYQPNYVEATSIIPGIQYYEQDYVKTKDTAIDPEKKYFEITTYQAAAEDEYYEYDTTTTGVTRYSVKFTQLQDASFDEFETYYIEVGGHKQVATDLDIQYGPFYYVDGMEEDANGEYIKKTFDSATNMEEYSEVLQPLVDRLSDYYEFGYVAVKTPETASGYYYIEYIKVEEPDETDLPTYYEKVDEYVVATDLNYEYSQTTGNAISIINDRNLYKLSNPALIYVKVTNPSSSDNPQEHGWYEISSYSRIVKGSSLNPHAEGLYELTYSPEDFNVVASPSGNPQEHGWYEYGCYYSTLYDDGTVYLDLGAEEQESDFPTEDNNWHDEFYSDVLKAGQSVTDKTSAIAALDSIVFPYPSWKWESLLNESVTTLYIPTQGEQYRTIIRESNMDPIQWQELPSQINHDAFEYALNTLLYMIKERLITNITILVDGGKVKCYSCVDASTVIKRIVNNNYMIWRNQINSAKDKIEKAKSISEIRAAFSMVKAYNQTLYLLEKILNQQSALYAKYIDQIIEEQIINDNETEVSL